ncbi:MAG: tyrosine-type recombinase/integrase [Myxococcales bacterium]|nr:tyrosine-type recombinase/integrase [Myxococcales bacterium]
MPATPACDFDDFTHAERGGDSAFASGDRHSWHRRPSAAVIEATSSQARSDASPLRAQRAPSAGRRGLGATSAGARCRVRRGPAPRLLKSEKLPEERRVRYLLAFTSGMRDGELAGLTWTDLDDSTVRVAKQVSTRARTPTRPKTRYAHRVLPLHPLTAEALKTWKATGWVLLVGRKPQPTDPVFPDQHGHPHRPRSAELLREDLEAAGCPTKYAGEYPIDFHATRRSFASWLEANEVPGDIVDRLLGQAGKSVRKRHYSATDLEVMRKAIETIRLDLQPHFQTVAFAACLAAPVQQAVRDSATISWSQLRDSSSRPTVYERVEGSGHERLEECQRVPRGETVEDRGCPVLAADVTPVGGASNGLAATRDAACAAWVRSKIEDAVRLLDNGDVAGARALLGEFIRSS